MKYTILGFQQEKLIKNGLDITDALILRTIKDMYSSASMEFIVENNIKLMWVNYTYLLNQIPIIGSKSNLMKRISKYNKKNLIKKILKHKKKGIKGNFSYIAPTKELDTLQDYDPYVNFTQPLWKNDTTLMSNLHNKGSSIKDSSIKDYKDIVAYLNSKTDKNFKHTSKKTRDLIKTRLNEGFTVKDFYKVIDIKVAEWVNNSKMEQYLRPETLFSNKFEGYLNQKHKESEEDKLLQQIREIRGDD